MQKLNSELSICPSPLAVWTSGQYKKIQDSVEDNVRTPSLKALALKVLSVDRTMDNGWTGKKSNVHPSKENVDNREKVNRLIPTAIIKHEANIPREWADAFARMDCMAKPTKLTLTCWQAVVDATGRLLDNHLPALINNGWQVEDIFSCHATAPEHNYSVMGLVFLIDGKEITHIDADSITLKTPGGAVQRYRKPQQGYHKVMVWELG